ncbi:hypothetical protein PPYR_05983 [Photinus pyralis]|uniref:Uncharacterized protein n=1 Tax=Photinus pyralis TaxID=7054 RepID=A0A5N4ASI8_PHOPY|nr:hypothetical protein PPYR_05983 [Photinus pyralis]
MTVIKACANFDNREIADQETELESESENKPEKLQSIIGIRKTVNMEFIKSPSICLRILNSSPILIL